MKTKDTIVQEIREGKKDVATATMELLFDIRHLTYASLKEQRERDLHLQNNHQKILENIIKP